MKRILHSNRESLTKLPPRQAGLQATRQEVIWMDFVDDQRDVIWIVGNGQMDEFPLFKEELPGRKPPIELPGHSKFISFLQQSFG
jgi:hypothetical protein